MAQEDNGLDNIFINYKNDFLITVFSKFSFWDEFNIKNENGKLDMDALLAVIKILHDDLDDLEITEKDFEESRGFFEQLYENTTEELRNDIIKNAFKNLFVNIQHKICISILSDEECFAFAKDADGKLDVERLLFMIHHLWVCGEVKRQRKQLDDDIAETKKAIAIIDQVKNQMRRNNDDA